MKILVVTNKFYKFKKDILSDERLSAYTESFIGMRISEFVRRNPERFASYDGIYMLDIHLEEDDKPKFVSKIDTLLSLYPEKMIIPYVFTLNTEEYQRNKYGYYGRYNICNVFDSKNIENLVMPKQEVLNESSVTEEVIAKIGLPMMIKTKYETSKDGSVQCNTAEEVTEFINKIKVGTVKNLFAQEYIQCNNTKERWVLYNGRVLNGAKYVHDSGYTEPVTFTAADEKFAKDMEVCFVGNYYLGIDFLRKDDKYYVVEGVTRPSKEIIECTHINHYIEIICDMVDKLKDK